MTYYDYYLKFADEAEANAILYTKEPIAWEDPVNPEDPQVPIEWMDKPSYDNIDTLGIIYEPTGEATIVDDMEVPVMVAIDGWHVNVRNMTIADELNAYAVVPTNPRRVWAGN